MTYGNLKVLVYLVVAATFLALAGCGESNSSKAAPTHVATSASKPSATKVRTRGTLPNPTPTMLTLKGLGYPTMLPVTPVPSEPAGLQQIAFVNGTDTYAPGKGAVRTAEFTTHGTWVVSYSIRCAGTNGSGYGDLSFEVEPHGGQPGSGDAVSVYTSGAPVQSRDLALVYHSSGQYFLSIESSCDFVVTVSQ